jgi:hypothetical protein
MKCSSIEQHNATQRNTTQPYVYFEESIYDYKLYKNKIDV